MTENVATSAFLQTFVSRSRCSTLSSGHSLPAQLGGVCLFADISGFTSLTESLHQSLGGQKGSEILTSILNNIFDALISHVHCYGGDVMGFAGDAMTCWYPDEHSSLHLAIISALAMQTEMKRFSDIPTPDGKHHTLTMKVGLSYGQTCRILAGDPIYGLFDVLTGSTLDRMAAAEHHANRGEIVCAPEIPAALGQSNDLAVWGEDREGYRPLLSFTGHLNEHPVSSPPYIDLDILHPYFHPELFAWLASSGEQFLGEFRPVVSVFVRFEGIQYEGDPQAGEKLDQYVRLVQGISHRYGGILARLDYGDKGSVMHVIFGAPVAHEDDEVRAVGWALDLQGEARSLPFITGQYIGMSRGVVYAGALGAHNRRGYTLMGDDVNASARLMQACQPGQVLVSQKIILAAQKQFMFHQFPGFQVKGKYEPIPVGMPVAPMPPMPQMAPPTPMVGRDAELAQIDEILNSLAIGTNRVLRIQGGTGAGKSRLAAELNQRAMMRGVRTLVGFGQSVGQGTPYLAWRDIVRTLFGLQPAWPAMQQAMQIQTMLQWINPEWIPQVPLLGDLLGLEIPDTPFTAALNPMQRQQALLGLVSDILGRTAQQQALLVLIEDVHWLDSASAALIEALAKRVSANRVLLVVTHRPADDPEHPILPGLQGLPNLVEMPLADLTPAAIQTLVTTRLGGEPPMKVLAMLQERVQGNPLFAEQFIEALRETSRLQMVNGRWVLSSNTGSLAKMPETILGVVLARLDRIDEANKLALKVASVVGTIFSLQALEVIHPTRAAPGSLASQLDGLTQRDLILQGQTGANPEYIFKHYVTRDVAYQTLLYSQRRELHKRLAAWYEAAYVDNLSPYYALLAHHWSEAEDAAKASHYLLLAGDEARRVYALSDAIKYYRRSLEFLQQLGDDDATARTYMQLGLTYHLAFEYRQARDAYEKGFTMWQKASENAPAENLAPASRPLYMDWLYMPTGLDPAFSNDVDTDGVVDQLFAGLVDLGTGMEIVPNLAQRWDISDDGRRYVFTLRTDARWSDGKPLTAHDFEYAWKRVLNPATGSPRAPGLYVLKGALPYHKGEAPSPDGVGVRASGDYTLEVELEQPTGYFLYLLATIAAYAVPRHVIEQLGSAWADPDKIVTCGPFCIETYNMVNDQDGKIVLKRFLAYFGRYKGNVEQVDLWVQPDADQRLSAYENDQLDTLTFRNLLSARERVRQRHSGEYLSLPWLHAVSVAFDTTRPPFHDSRVRQAFVHAIDRERFADVVLEGFTFPATGGYVPPGMPGHSPGIGLPYDPERARQLLAQAGFAGGVGFPQVEFLAGVGAEPEMVYLAEQWKENLGVSIAWHTVGWDIFLGRMEKERPNLFLDPWVADYADPDSFLRAALPLHWTGWKESEYTRLVDTARQVSNQQRRMELYAQADKILIEAAAIMPFKYMRLHFLFKPWVKRFPAVPGEWWYFKDVVLAPP